MRVAGPGIAVTAGLAIVLAASAPGAAGQEECSCAEEEPTTSVELRITATEAQDHSRIGPEQETLVIDLRGQQTALVGDAPQLLTGVDLAEVPVLMAVDDGAAGAEPCGEERPAAGSNLSITGRVYVEETGPVVWTGPCQGTVTIEAAAVSDSTDEDTWGRGLAVSAAVLAGLAVLCLSLVALTARRRR